MEALKNLGISDAFNESANFFGISKYRLIISEVLQKAFIKVSEQGTESSVATAVRFSLGSSLVSPPEFRINRPFVFQIIDRKTRIILFAGTLGNPSA